MKHTAYIIPIFIAMVLVFAVSLTSLGTMDFDVRSKAAGASYSPFWAYDTHPNFWPAGSNRWTAKKYIRLPSTPNPGFSIQWVWSGPHASGGRYVIYQKYPGGKPGATHEWELWTGNPATHTATVQKYGGTSESQAFPASKSAGDCTSGTTGTIWPNLQSGDTVRSVGNITKIGGVCQPNGSIGVRMYQVWDKPNTSVRNGYCGTYVPASVTPGGNKICREAPNAGIVYQHYVFGTNPNVSSPSYQHGCEATVYAWGYPYSEAERYRLWFRNGELRWSEYLNLGSYPSVKDHQTEQVWWDANCQRAFTEKPNFLYSGTYKLTNTEYSDK